MKYKFLGLILVILSSFFAFRTLLIPGFFPMHDDTQVARVFEMGKVLGQGIFPVRWVPDLGYGYGYPIFNFYAPFAYYIGGFFLMAGFDALVATKLMMGLGIVLAGISMYVLAREFWGEIGGFISGLFYLYAPFHGVDIYVRGDVAEYYAYAFIPLAFYGIWKVYKTERLKFIIVGAFGYAGIILSHNLTAMMITPFLLFLIFLLCLATMRSKKIATIYLLLFTAFYGLLLSAFYWMPALLEMHYTNVFSQIGGGADFHDHFICLRQLWDSPWGFGGSVPGCSDGLSFKIGKLHILFVLFSAVAFGFSYKNNPHRHALLFSYAGFLVTIFLTLNTSQFIWDSFSAMAFFQYPWRFLLLIAFFSSFIAGSVWLLIVFLGEKFPANRKLFVIGMIVFIFLFVYAQEKNFSPQTIVQRVASDFTSDAALRWKASKISDEYMPPDFQKPNNENEIPSGVFILERGTSRIGESIEKVNRFEAKIEALSPSIIRINIAYFPPWKILVNEKNIPFTITKQGLLCSIPKGDHTVLAVFEETMVEKLANTISLIALIFLVIGIIVAKKKRRLDL